MPMVPYMRIVSDTLDALYDKTQGMLWHAASCFSLT